MAWVLVFHWPTKVDFRLRVPQRTDFELKCRAEEVSGSDSCLPLKINSTWTQWTQALRLGPKGSDSFPSVANSVWYDFGLKN